ncbi:MAG: TIM barrel protein [Bacteroidales bacterium]|nr:TIM barrel protein [Bacteroidales bacterium]
MRLGLSSYTYTWAIGVPGSEPENPMLLCQLLEKAEASGIDLVQIADNLPVEKLKSEELELLAYYSVEKGISIEMGGRGLTPEHTMKCLKTAEHIGSPILRMVIDAANYEPEIPDIKAILKELEPELKSRRIRLAIENHDRLKAREFEDIIQSAGSEWIGICLDSVNSMGAGEGFETVSEILIPYTFNLHIKDFAILRAPHKMGLVIEGRPAGKGMLNIPDLIRRTSATGLCNSAILELWTPPEIDIEATILKEEEWAGESIRYLKSVVY